MTLVSLETIISVQFNNMETPSNHVSSLAACFQRCLFIHFEDGWRIRATNEPDRSIAGVRLFIKFQLFSTKGSAALAVIV